MIDRLHSTARIRGEIARGKWANICRSEKADTQHKALMIRLGEVIQPGVSYTIKLAVGEWTRADESDDEEREMEMQVAEVITD